MEPELALLDRYLAGDCTHAEASTVRRWLDTDASAQLRLAEIAEVRNVSRTGLVWDTDSGWRAMQLQMGVTHPAAVQDDVSTAISGEASGKRPDNNIFAPQSLPSTTNVWRKFVPQAKLPHYLAAALIAGIVTLAGWPKLKTDAAAPRSHLVSTYTTGAGQRATITLPDGSPVVLNVGSRLQVPVDYDLGNRLLELSGEALFTVRPNQAAPFVVVTGASTTRVLGTSFLVRQYENDSTAVIAVRDGKVMVESTVLTAMQQATVNREQRVSDVTLTDSGQFSFAAGVLSLRDMPLPNAIPQLNRWYDTDIRLGDSRLMHRNIAGGFTAGSVTDLAAILELTYNVRAVREGRTLTLYSKP